MPSEDGKYNPHSGYSWLMGPMQVFPGAKSCVEEVQCTKTWFILWLALHKKLLTRDRLKNWSMVIIDDSFLLCGRDCESIDHLFSNALLVGSCAVIWLSRCRLQMCQCVLLIGLIG